jgi:hypothetical protein
MIITLRKITEIALLAAIVLFPVTAGAQLLGAIGGIEGLGEEAADTPILMMTGEANLSEGEGVVGVSYLYGRFTRAFGDDMEDPSSEHGWEAHDRRAVEATNKVLSLSYGVTSNFNLGLSVPFSQVRARFPVLTTDVATEEKLDGIGNVAVVGKYQFWSDPNLATRLVVQFPSGYEVGADFLIVNLDLAYSVVVGTLSFHAQAGYVYTDQDRQGRDRLDTLVANAAVARRMGDPFVLVTELIYQQRVGDDDLEGVIGDDGVIYQSAPTQLALDFAPGFKIQITDAVTVAATVRIALINTLEFGYDAVYMLIAGYSF